MELNGRVQALENEINLLKIEMKQVLVDLRDTILQNENPFSPRTFAGVAEQSSAPAASPSVDGAPTLPAESDSGAAPQPAEANMTADLTTPASTPNGAHQPAFAAASPDTRHPPAQAGAAVAVAGPMPSSNGTAVHQAEWREAAYPDTNGHTAKPAQYAAQSASMPGEMWGMLTVASLAKWVDSALKQVGKDRLDAIIEIYELTGGSQVLTPETKQALKRMAHLSEAENGAVPAATMNDCIALLTQLDALLRTNGRSESTVLSLLTEMNLL
jgi:hypothetical protein